MAGLATASMVLDALLLWGEWNLVNRDGFPTFVGWICGIAAAAILMLLVAVPWLARHHPETLFPDSEVVDAPAGHRKVQACLRSIARVRRITEPVVLLVKEMPSKGVRLRLFGGMIDAPGRTDVLCLGSHLVKTLSFQNLRAVVAHEMRHSNSVRSKLLIAQLFTAVLLSTTLYAHLASVTWAMTFLQGSLDSVVASLAAIGLWRLVIKPFRLLLTSALSRWNEHVTDALAAKDLGESRSMRAALRNVERGIVVDHRLDMTRRGTFAYRIFCSHPSTETRIERLRWLEGH